MDVATTFLLLLNRPFLSADGSGLVCSVGADPDPFKVIDAKSPPGRLERVGAEAVNFGEDVINQELQNRGFDSYGLLVLLLRFVFLGLTS